MFRSLKQYFGTYAGGETSTKRKSPGSSTKSVDQELTSQKRRRAIENARDLDKNFAIAAWAIRRHLDYVSGFNFEPQTGNSQVDEQLDSLIQSFSLPDNCHVARRHSLSDLVRLTEAARTVDGDILLVKLRSGHLQAIEADRIQNPPTAQVSREQLKSWVNGVKTTQSGKALAYSVWSRDSNGQLNWERNIQADFAFHHGYFQRLDQVRGVSPLMSALDTFRDVYEGFGYALAKAKVTQLFGLVINSDGEDEFGTHTTSSGEAKVDFGEGPFKLELGLDEQASFLESGSPPLELQQFTQQMVGVAIKALDLPFSFYDEAHTNFFGSKAAFTHYEKSAAVKQAQNQQLLNNITRWRLAGYLLSGQLTLPRGWTLDDLAWEWVPKGTPWWNPLQEVNADMQAVKLGVKTRQQVVREKFGKDWEKDILPQLVLEDELLQQSRGWIFDPSEEAEDEEPTSQQQEDPDEQ